jgi:hypothetical protein
MKALREWKAGNQSFRLTATGVLQLRRGGNWHPHYLNHQCPMIVRELAKLVDEVREAAEPKDYAEW